MTDTEVFVKLKHFPTRATIEYLNSLPPNIPYLLYKQLFADGEVGTLVETRLLHILSAQEWKDIVDKNLLAILVDYYEAQEIKQQWLKKII